jgi:hypothetical protein
LGDVWREDAAKQAKNNVGTKKTKSPVLGQKWRLFGKNAR